MGKLKTGRVHIYTGNGKGKTTASLGLALRAAASGLRVCMFQFLKSSGSSAENRIGFHNFNIVCFDRPHPMFGGSRGKLPDGIRKDIAKIKRVMKSGKYDVIILDEAINCVSSGFVPESCILGVIKARPRPVELVLTGRSAPAALIEAADYVTRFDKVKHPFDDGARARRGIEY